MLKNKDGSYNKFPLVIISLIILISICVIGMFITENVNLPELHIPTFVETFIQKNNSSNPLLLYNDTVYFNYSNDKNQTLVSSTKYITYGDNYTWTSPPSTNNVTYYYVAGGGGGNYTSGASPSTNVTYFVAGGGGTGGAGIIIINKSRSEEVSPVQDINRTNDKINTTDNSGDLSATNLTLQNFQSVATYVMSFTLGSWFLILMFSIMLIIMKSRQALFGTFIIIMFAYFFNFITFLDAMVLVSAIIIVYIFMTGLFDK